MRERKIHTLGYLLSVFCILLSGKTLADTTDKEADRQACLAKIDPLHSCACNDIRGSKPNDPGAFNINRADIRAAFVELQNSSHYSADKDASLIQGLKAAYDEQRDLLPCHDRVAMRVSNFSIAQDFCIVDSKTAKALGKIQCRYATMDEVDTAKKAVSDRIERIMGDFEQEIKQMSYCRLDQMQIKQNMRQIAVEYPPCKIDLKSMFPNNKSVLTQAQAKTIISHIQNHSCYQQYVQSGLHLKKIEINSSSSLLANTGEAAKKSFLDLSKERADEIDSKIVAMIFDQSLLNSLVYEKNYKGKNGDGSSGSCPYAYDPAKKNWFRKAFPTNEQLEVNKRTELNLYFDSAQYEIDTDIVTDMASVPCKRVHFYCQ